MRALAHIQEKLFITVYREEHINSFFNGKYFNIVAIALFAASAIYYFCSGLTISHVNNSGPFFPSSNLWLEGYPVLSLLLNMTCIIAMGYLLKLLNSIYGFIRSHTAITLSVFILLEMSNPHITTQFFDGTALCLLVTMLTFIMFNSYQQRHSSYSIYGSFALLGFYSMFQYSCLYLIPVYILGFMQMRVMNFKGLLAMLFGLVTAPWIAFGFGMITFNDISTPEMRNVWEVLDKEQSLSLIIMSAATAVFALMLMATNMFHLISYKAQRRAYNGFFSVLTIATIIMACADYTNVLNYLPVLNLCFAIHAGHSFTINKFDKRYIAILILLAACCTAYIYNF